jgi:hypothetical protein
MEPVSAGTLIEIACDTFCWIDVRSEIPLRKGQFLLFVDSYPMTGRLRGLNVARVIHPELGMVECLAHEIKKVENAS